MSWRGALAALALLTSAATADARTGERPRTNAPAITAYKIILVGDSTMAPASGWGSAFCARHVKSSIACLNLGRGGRSTRSYRQEGSWAIVLAEARVAGYAKTYVLIQFGHNDQSPKPERWTELGTEFPSNLARFVADLRASGAVPVLVTPLARREFKAGKLVNTLLPWADAVRRVASDSNIPLVDLNADSAALIQEMGADRATELAMAPPLPAELDAARRGTTLPARPPEQARLPDVPTEPDGPRGQVMRKFDYTHLGDSGARLIARLVAKDLAKAVPALRSQLLP